MDDLLTQEDLDALLGCAVDEGERRMQRFMKITIEKVENGYTVRINGKLYIFNTLSEADYHVTEEIRNWDKKT